LVGNKALETCANPPARRQNPRRPSTIAPPRGRGSSRYSGASVTRRRTDNSKHSLLLALPAKALRTGKIDKSDSYVDRSIDEPRIRPGSRGAGGWWRGGDVPPRPQVVRRHRLARPQQGPVRRALGDRRRHSEGGRPGDSPRAVASSACTSAWRGC
jgi:hypothetical protein